MMPRSPAGTRWFFHFVVALALLALMGSPPASVVAQVPEVAPPETALQAPGDYQRHYVDGPTLVVEAEHATARLTVYRPRLVRVDWLRPGETPARSFAVVQPADSSRALQVTDREEMLRVRTDSLVVTVRKSPVRVQMRRRGAAPLWVEADSNVVWSDTSATLRAQLHPEAHVYGSGERGRQLDLRGRRFGLYNQAHYGYREAPEVGKINVPFVATSRGYGLFVDTTYPAQFDVGASDSTRLAFTAEGGPLTYYLIAGAHLSDQLDLYTWLTGRPSLPPKWAFGYIQSKMAYRSEAVARAVVDTLRQRDFPVDALVVDLAWFEHMGDLWWNRDAWPTPFDMMRDLRERGVRTVAVTETYLTEPSRLFQPAIDSSFVGRTPEGDPYRMPEWWSCDGCDIVLLDVTDPDARDWWWRQHPPFMGDVMAGLWTDLGEPERHPNDMQHHLGPTPKIHNVYNNLWAQTLYRGLRAWRPEQRVFNLTRAGTAGIQRYGTVLWSGDVSRTWTGFQAQLPMLLNTSLSGVPFYSSDLGGFAAGTTTPELYIRWFQHGTFTPTMRPHGDDRQPTEPWRFGDEAERIARRFARLRYRLMPYIYTLAHTAHDTGTPMVRPLTWANPQDPALQTEDDAYLFGDALLVAPVVRDSVRQKEVTLPQGTWINYWTDAVVRGGRTVTVDAPLDQIPLFVRRGHILPTRPVASHTGAQPVDTLGLEIYPSPDASAPYTLYEDDGITTAHTEGQFATTRIRQFWETQFDGTQDLVLHIGGTAGEYDGAPSQRTVHAVIHQMANAPSQMRVDGLPVPLRASRQAMEQRGGAYYNGASERVHIQFRGSIRRAHRIEVSGVGLVKP